MSDDLLGAWIDFKFGHIPRKRRALFALPALCNLVDQMGNRPIRFHAWVLTPQTVRWSVEP